ncbi:MAG: hypothetical protein ACR2QG_07285 [Gammaproteobacteria bacterium]
MNKKLFLLVPLVITLVTGCVQFTTNEQELIGLQQNAELQADDFVECVKVQAAEIYSTTDPGFIRDAVMNRCADERQGYIAAEKKSLSAQYMMTEKPLKEKIAALDDRARIELAETLLARPATPANPQAAAAPAPPVVAAPTANQKPIAWNEQQRVYLDCMEDQADKYFSLNESAEAISDVAVLRCRDYLGAQSVVALEREGRAVVMGRVMDNRLKAAQPR